MRSRGADHTENARSRVVACVGRAQRWGGKWCGYLKTPGVSKWKTTDSLCLDQRNMGPVFENEARELRRYTQ